MDVLADLLLRARARGALFARSQVRADHWGIEFPDDSQVGFHVVVEGEAWLSMAGEPPLRMLQGDVALVKGGRPHGLASGPTELTIPLERFVTDRAVATGPRSFDVAGSAAPTVFLCGAYVFEGSLCDSLLDALPPKVFVPARDGSLRAVVSMLADEIGRDAPGQQTILDRLLDLALVYTLRAQFAAAGDAAPAWYRALADPVAGPALRAVHEAPSKPWTVESLAREAAMSRAAFARRFKTVTGETPLGYLSRWRMSLAAEALQRSGTTIAAVGRDVGYTSEFAFAAAFKRHHGQAPGRYRAHAASQEPRPNDEV
jgi:AraC-like DNA-binding protein